MSTISRMAAAVFVTRIKTKLHRHSPKRMNNHYQKLAMQRYSNSTKNMVNELNSYNLGKHLRPLFMFANHPRFQTPAPTRSSVDSVFDKVSEKVSHLRQKAQRTMTIRTQGYSLCSDSSLLNRQHFKSSPRKRHLSVLLPQYSRPCNNNVPSPRSPTTCRFISEEASPKLSP